MAAEGVKVYYLTKEGIKTLIEAGETSSFGLFPLNKLICDTEDCYNLAAFLKTETSTAQYLCMDCAVNFACRD